MLTIQQKKKHIELLMNYGNYFLLALLSYFVSRVSIYTSIFIFSVAYTSIFLNKKWLCSIVGVSALLGMLSLNYYSVTTKYMLIVICLVLLSHLAEKIQVELNHFRQAVLSSIVIFLIGFILSLSNGQLIYGVLLCTVEAILSFILSMVFSYSKTFFSLKKEKRTFSQEELIASTVIISIAIVGTYGITFFHMDLFLLLSYIMLIYVGYAYGPGLGSAAGVTLGLLMNLTMEKEPMLIAILAISGILAGIFRELGKWASLIGFVVGNILLVLYAYESNIYLNYFIAICLSSAIFGLLPVDSIKKLKTLVKKKAGLTHEDYLERVQDVTAHRLKIFSETFDQLAVTFETISEKRLSLGKDDISKLMDEVVNQVCEKCDQIDYCWNKQFYNTYQTVYSIIHAADERGIIAYKDIPESFYKQCYRYKDFIKTTNKIYEIFRINLNWYNKMIDSRRLVSDQLKGISGIMDNLSQDIRKNIHFNLDMEEEVLIALEEENIFANRVFIYKDNDEKHIVEIIMQLKRITDQNLKQIRETVDKVLGIETKMDGVSKQTRGIFKLILKEKRLYRVSTGTARVAKETLSGDNFSSLPINDGKHLIALSDGMGTGYKANEESRATVELLEQLLSSGFDNETAIKMINSLLILKSAEESFSTLDIALIDLHTGICQIIKIGGATIFIVGKDKLRIINSTTLPVGILEKIEIDRHEVKLCHGDLIIMMTDGVVDALQKGFNNPEAGFKEVFSTIDSFDPKKIAEEILDGVLQKVSKVEDDMTVVVNRIWKER